MLELPSTSLTYIKSKITASADPTADTVTVAFVTSGLPGALDWKTGSWQTVTANGITSYYARCLVGPAGAFVPAAGLYRMYVKITDSPEVPVLACGTVQFT